MLFVIINEVVLIFTRVFSASNRLKTPGAKAGGFVICYTKNSSLRKDVENEDSPDERE